MLKRVIVREGIERTSMRAIAQELKKLNVSKLQTFGNQRKNKGSSLRKKAHLVLS